MNIDNKTYKKYVRAHAPKSPLLKNLLIAFLVGGGICAVGQWLLYIFEDVFFMQKEDAGLLCSLTFVLIAVVLTAFGVFEKIAKRAGGGTLVPITGFANAVASSAIDSKNEGFILGLGAKIFLVAGPVLLYGTVAGTIWGVIYYIMSLF